MFFRSLVAALCLGLAKAEHRQSAGIHRSLGNLELTGASGGNISLSGVAINLNGHDVVSIIPPPDRISTRTQTPPHLATMGAATTELCPFWVSNPPSSTAPPRSPSSLWTCARPAAKV